MSFVLPLGHYRQTEWSVNEPEKDRLTPEERAVLEAAMVWRRKANTETANALDRACDALRASRKPMPRYSVRKYEFGIGIFDGPLLTPTCYTSPQNEENLHFMEHVCNLLNADEERRK